MTTTRHFGFRSAFAPLLGAAGTIVACSLSPAVALDLCRAIALQPVVAREDSNSIIPKGGYDTTITQFNVDHRTGESVFCSHGGYCYPTHVRVGGKMVEALHLTNCAIDRSHGTNSGSETSYPVGIIRSKTSPAQLRRADLDDRLRELGLCNACASNVVHFYTTSPNSRCAKITKRALEGNPNAVKTLQDFPAYCQLQ